MQAWLEIDLGAIRHNVDQVRRTVGRGVGIIGVVKSDAYGQGLERVTSVLAESGVIMFAVISLEEAIRVRQVTKHPVLIMGYLTSQEINESISNGFILSLYDRQLVPIVERIAARLGKTARVHVKVETGLNRLGMSIEEATDFLINIRHFPHLKVEAIFSHLANAEDRSKNLEQLTELHELIVNLQGKIPLLPIHLASSRALANFSEGYFDAVRVGLAFYGGVLPSSKPTLVCKAIVLQVKDLAAGEGVSYGPIFTAREKMQIAVIGIGYAEGLASSLSGSAEVIVGGQIRPIIGQICMNLSVVDVTNLSVKRGDGVIIIGSQADSEGNLAVITVADLAKKSGLRHHEIITRLGTSLPKQYLN